MTDPARRDTLQRYVDDLTAQYWRQTPDGDHSEVRAAGAMHRLEELCGDLERAWESKGWFQATSACAVCAELLTASAKGGVFDVSHVRTGEVASIADFLKTMRNACFHPANLNPRESKKGAPHVRLLAELLARRGEHALADRLWRDHGTVRSKELADLAVRLLDQFGVVLAEGRPALWKG